MPCAPNGSNLHLAYEGSTILSAPVLGAMGSNTAICASTGTGDALPEMPRIN